MAEPKRPAPGPALYVVQVLKPPYKQWERVTEKPVDRAEAAKLVETAWAAGHLARAVRILVR